ncbi:hydroxysqualene dehydroxylase HpnE [Noviherbaspirillum aridicola]|uniref:Phytoene desaturase n=1 Tax=Noviherbaspirillum aridicola TaxID=2849687 RepID=A0ABQ4Q059_9BURK|nr:hydroxysqualene dehydroxylase HpnE [Noviherbaspirillum aridicola]GIZ50140.1 phytoene desaturase [Noviherbaspirillum aridicola]
MPDAIIAGGGLAGLACAVALADRGLQVAVLERGGRLGGRAGSWRDDVSGDMVDIGPHVVHSEYRNMLALLQRLGTRELIQWQPEEVIALATAPGPMPLGHSPLPPPLSLIPGLLKAPGLRLRDHLSMAIPTWRAMKLLEEDIGALDAQSALDFMRRSGVSERMIEWWWKFAAMVVTNVPLERCSAASLLRIHGQLSGYRRLHFGFAAVGLGELYAEQAARVIRTAGGEVRTGCAVRAIEAGGRAPSVVLADGTRLHAGHIISALPPHELDSVLPAEWKRAEPFASLRRFEPSPYVSCYLWFDRPVMPRRFVSHLWSPARLNYDFYDLSRIRRGWEGRASVVATNIIYSHRVHHLGDDEIVRATVAELAEFAPAAAQARLVHARVHRIPMAIPCPVVGFERMRPATRTRVPGLILAGDWVKTGLPCTMESAVMSGMLSAEEVLAALGKPQRLARPPRMPDGLSGLVRRAARAYRGSGGGPGR